MASHDSASRARYRRVRALLGGFDDRAELTASLYRVYLIAVLSLVLLPMVGSAAAVLLELRPAPSRMLSAALIVAPALAAVAAVAGRYASALRVSAPEGAFLLAGQFSPRLVLGSRAAVQVAGWAVLAAVACLAVTFGNGWSAAEVTASAAMGAGTGALAAAAALAGLGRWRSVTIVAGGVGAALAAGWVALEGPIAPLVVGAVTFGLGVAGAAGLMRLALAAFDVGLAVRLTQRRERLTAALMLGDQRQVRRAFEPHRIWLRSVTLRAATWRTSRSGRGTTWGLIARRDALGWARDLPACALSCAIVVAGVWAMAAVPAFGLAQLACAWVVYGVVGRLFTGAQAHLDNAGSASLFPWSFAATFARHLLAPLALLVVLVAGGLGIAAIWPGLAALGSGAGASSMASWAAAGTVAIVVVAFRLSAMATPNPPPEAFLSAPYDGATFARMMWWSLRGWRNVALAVLGAAALAYWQRTPYLGLAVLAGCAVLGGWMLVRDLRTRDRLPDPAPDLDDSS